MDHKFGPVMFDPVRQASAVDAIRALPERTRAVFMLHRFEGYSYGRIAAHLGISTRQVERDMTKALARIHEALTGE